MYDIYDNEIVYLFLNFLNFEIKKYALECERSYRIHRLEDGVPANIRTRIVGGQ